MPPNPHPVPANGGRVQRRLVPEVLSCTSGMTSWQKRLRIVLAIFGIVFAGLVYRSIGERRLAVPSQPVDRMDPKAILETTQAVLQQVRGTEQEFEIRSQRTLTYEDGSAKHFNVEITVRRTEGRVFVITAGEAQAGPK